MNQGKCIVASGHPEVSQTAVEIMADGGNAFDAAVAAGFASVVAEQALTSLGGGGFLLARTAAGEEILFDFFVNTPGVEGEASDLAPHFFPVTVHFPGSDQDFNVGRGSIAVPGTLKGLLHIHARLGRLPLERILRPAIRLAQQGHTVCRCQAYFLGLLKPIMTLSPAGRAVYAPNGRYVRQGDQLVNPDIATFLRTLVIDHGRSFYEDSLAATIAADMRAGQGLLTQQDLAAYRVIERTPLATPYKGFRVLTNPLPSMGGCLIRLALSILAAKDNGPHQWGSEEQITRTAATMIEVEERRNEAFQPIGLAHHSETQRQFHRGTTHLSLADDEGNVASMTTSNGEGSGYIVANTGIMLNNMMGEDDLHPEGFHACPPGQRVASMMSPTIMLHDNRPVLALGSGGSKRIRTAIVQVISNVVDYGMDIESAITAPRIHWDGQCMQVEPGWPQEAIAALKHIRPVNLWTTSDMYFGGVHTVVPGQTGFGDPRRGGSTVEIQRPAAS